MAQTQTLESRALVYMQGDEMVAHDIDRNQIGVVQRGDAIQALNELTKVIIGHEAAVLENGIEARQVWMEGSQLYNQLTSNGTQPKDYLKQIGGNRVNFTYIRIEQRPSGTTILSGDDPDPTKPFL